MKLVRYGEAGAEQPGMIDDDGNIRALAGHVGDIDAASIGADVLDRIARLDPASLPLVEGAPRIGPCVGNIGKIIAIGLNYSDHAAETGLALPSEPVIFSKAITSICGPDDDLVLPRDSDKTDWEVELGIVIGREAKYIDQDQALDHVAGYCLVNDVSERAWQIERGGQWVKGKSHDGFCSVGPWLVTRDEVPDPQNLGMRTRINGALMQDGTTANQIFGVAHVVAYLTQFMRLMPGDLIPTGTPAGVGMGLKPPRYLQNGDRVEISIDALGAQSRNVLGR
ncbi:MAG: fumarylacetoacetate hydrolase family protein [Hyphomicrobiales bacterium]